MKKKKTEAMKDRRLFSNSDLRTFPHIYIFASNFFLLLSHSSFSLSFLRLAKKEEKDTDVIKLTQALLSLCLVRFSSLFFFVCHALLEEMDRVSMVSPIVVEMHFTIAFLPTENTCKH